MNFHSSHRESDRPESEPEYFIILIFCVCTSVGMCTPRGTYGSQLPGVSSRLTTREFWGSKSGFKTWQQVSLHTETSQWSFLRVDGERLEFSEAKQINILTNSTKLY